MRLVSSAFENNEEIPREFTCDGENYSPPLTFKEVPSNAKSLVLIMEDPDAPLITFVHWVVWNIPPGVKGFEKGEQLKYPMGKNSARRKGYMGPCPPFGKHRYFFKLYALDATLELKPGSTKKKLKKAMKEHVIEKAELIGIYSRQKKQG